MIRINMIEILKEYWLLITGIFTGVGSAVSWYFNIKKKRKADNDSYDEKNRLLLEKFKIKLLELMDSKVQDTEQIIELKLIQDLMKKQCPRCYNNVIKSIKNIQLYENGDQETD